MRLFLFLVFLLCLPVLFIFAYQQGYLEGYVTDADIPDEPFIQAELRENTSGEDLSIRIDRALQEGNYDDAVMYQEIASYAGMTLNTDTKARLDEEKSTSSKVVRNTGNFLEGFVTGDGNDSASFAGALASDLTVVGDVRDIGTEGTKLVTGQDYSRLILGLSVVGLAATTATVVTGGGALPARAGVSLLKVAGKAGTLIKSFASEITRLVSEAVNFPKLGTTLKSVDLTDVAATRRAVSDYTSGVSTVKLMPVLDDVAALEKNVGPAESVRLMRSIENTEDLASITKMSGKLGNKTRGIIELTGKTSLRAFKTAMNLILLALEWVWAIGAALGLALLRGVFNAVRGRGRSHARPRSRFTQV
jgi:hypothetical protein